MKAYLLRLYKNPFYEAGLVIAVIATAVFTRWSSTLTVFNFGAAENATYFITCAPLGFFSLFTALFINVEYSDGVIRNRIIAGHTQTEVYLKYLFTQYIAVVTMFACWLAGGLIGGANITADFLAKALVSLMASINFVSFLTLIGMRLRKKLLAGVLGVASCYTLLTSMLMGNAFLLLSGEGLLHNILLVIYHLSPVGQWFIFSRYGEQAYCFSIPVEVLISLGMSAVCTLIGLAGIEKRELV